jgi:hypothetical protein
LRQFVVQDINDVVTASPGQVGWGKQRRGGEKKRRRTEKKNRGEEERRRREEEKKRRREEKKRRIEGISVHCPSCISSTLPNLPNLPNSFRTIHRRQWGATFTCVDKLDVGDGAVPVAVQAIDQVGDVLGTGLDPHFHETTFELPDRDAPTVVAVEFRKQF